MIDINELKIYVDYISNKEQSGNNYSPEQFNMLVKQGVEDIQRWLIGLEANYSVGAPLPPVAYEVTQKVKDDLRWLKANPTISVDSQGKMLIPEDYVYVTSITFKEVVNTECCGPEVTLRSVERIDDDKWANRCSSSIKKPTKKYPVCIFYDKDYVLFEPKDLFSVDFTYIKEINPPFWNYYIDSDSEVPIYTPTGSINVEMPAILLNDLARIILGYMGINLRETELLNYADNIKTKGV
tara:strand:+ start:8698 stop:9414 length:717 start_codon:yes stop_codon:yes gene_type:complete